MLREGGGVEVREMREGYGEVRELRDGERWNQEYINRGEVGVRNIYRGRWSYTQMSFSLGDDWLPPNVLFPRRHYDDCLPPNALFARRTYAKNKII